MSVKEHCTSRNVCWLFTFATFSCVYFPWSVVGLATTSLLDFLDDNWCDPIREIEMTMEYFILLKIVRLIDKSAKFKFQQQFLKDQNANRQNKIAAQMS